MASRPLRILLGYAPRSGADVVARAMLPRLQDAFRQGVVVENKPGAGGVLAGPGSRMVGTGMVRDRLQAEFVKAATAPEVRLKMEEAGRRITGTTCEEFPRQMRDDAARWGMVVAATGFKQNRRSSGSRQPGPTPPSAAQTARRFRRRSPSPPRRPPAYAR